jgi:desulfoferrodoxin-like iron-binding protein
MPAGKNKWRLKMKGYVCKVCGYISIDGTIPDVCPVCFVPKDKFVEDNNAIVEPTDATDKVELNKKHIPKILVVRKCGLIPDECTDAHIKVGEITHPMLKEHHIRYIDAYIDKKYVARVHLTPEKLNPAISLHIKVHSGKLTVIAKCNIHGAWMSETDL